MPIAKDVHQPTPHTQRDRTTAATRRPSTATGWEAEADTHLIRLCLDLQLDAMLLTMGAAAASTLPDSTTQQGIDVMTDGEQSATAPPWHRWVGEDVQMVCSLAADVMSGGAALPSTLGSDLDHAVPAAAVDNLIARYESMLSLLGDVLRTGTGETSPHHTRVQEALARCERRLRELRASRLEHTPPRGISLPDPDERASLPGEWLG